MLNVFAPEVLNELVGTSEELSNSPHAPVDDTLEETPDQVAGDAVIRMGAARLRGSRGSNATIRTSSSRTITFGDQDAGSTAVAVTSSGTAVAVTVAVELKRKKVNSGSSDHFRPRAIRRRDRLATEEPSSQSASDADSTDNDEQARPHSMDWQGNISSDDDDLVSGMGTLK